MKIGDTVIYINEQNPIRFMQIFKITGLFSDNNYIRCKNCVLSITNVQKIEEKHIKMFKLLYNK